MPRGSSMASKPRDKTCCGVVSGTKVSISNRRKSKPQPWVVRKMTILIVLGIFGYTGYAYIGRLCLPMIERKSWAFGSRTTGILLLVFFLILFLWIIWAYIKVIFTPPGYARHHVEKSERPRVPGLFSTVPSINETLEQNGAPNDIEVGHSEANDDAQNTSTPANVTQNEASDKAVGPSHDAHNPSSLAMDLNAGVLDAIPKPTALPAEVTDEKLVTPVASTQSSSDTPARQGHLTKTGYKSGMDAKRARKLEKEAERNKRLDELNIFRKPPTTPILQPIFRYCEYDEILKPYRAHHCRSCGTCVLKYDHHCPWIGQCVGARNHKFFMNFCFATAFFTAYVFATVLPFVLKSGSAVDAHHIALLPLSGLFLTFTTALFVSHVRLITHGQTTVEGMEIKAREEREDHMFSRVFSCWEWSAKRKRRKIFDEEWGVTQTEGNMWWRGNEYDEWVDVMGDNWLGWIFPIGRSLGDGLSYPVNPRFDADGRLKKRSEWPETLR